MQIEGGNVMLVVRGLRKVYSRETEPDSAPIVAIDGLSFTERRGEFVVIVGQSGCGKTTLLKLVAGLEPATSGEIIVDGVTVDGPPGNAIYVFQEYSKSLFPWRTVAGNVALGFERHVPSRAARDRRTRHYIDMVGLTAAAERYPWELSGGMQQRVVVARALACEPAVLLFDEPFGSLDAMNRASLEDKLLTLWSELAPTILFVTHDVDEAVYLADRVLVLAGPPARIVADIPIDLPRPRDQVETRSSLQFATLRKKIYGLLLADSDE